MAEDRGRQARWYGSSFVDHDGIFEGVIAKTFPLPGEDPNEICAKCTDDRKNAPLLGLSFIRDMKRDGLKYENGNVLDPRDGKIYKAKMTVSPDGQSLTMRGYWGFRCSASDETWSRLPDTAMASARSRHRGEIPALALAAAQTARENRRSPRSSLPSWRRRKARRRHCRSDLARAQRARRPGATGRERPLRRT